MLCVEGAHKLLNEGAAVMSSETLQTTGGRVDGYERRCKASSSDPPRPRPLS